MRVLLLLLSVNNSIFIINLHYNRFFSACYALWWSWWSWYLVVSVQWWWWWWFGNVMSWGDDDHYPSTQEALDIRFTHITWCSMLTHHYTIPYPPPPLPLSLPALCTDPNWGKGFFWLDNHICIYAFFCIKYYLHNKLFTWTGMLGR